jgi:hypothetical protein
MLEGYALIFEKDCDFCHVFWGCLPVFEGNTDDIGNVGSAFVKQSLTDCYLR